MRLTVPMRVLLLTVLVIVMPDNKMMVQNSSYPVIAEVAKKLSSLMYGPVYPRGSYEYERRRIVHNGLCTHLYPDLVAVPKRSEDVSAIVRVARAHNLEVSVRSGGHSFTCQSIKQGGIYIDMRSMNRVDLVSPNLAILGPGSTWRRVLGIISPEKFTMIHGQCRSVGVGGYILGGGVNVVGTSERYGSAGHHVVQYTMVDANGNILYVSKYNTTVFDPDTGHIHTLYNDHGLYHAMQGAGQSYGVVTEFLYKIYPRPETLPVLAMIYVESPSDVRKLERVVRDGRYHITWFVLYAFRPLAASIELTPTIAGAKLFPYLLRVSAGKRTDPIFVSMVDNSPYAGRHTNRHEAMKVLKYYGVKVAKNEHVANLVLPNMLDLDDYETQYLTKAEKRKLGYQAVESSNMMNLHSLKALDDLIFKDPVFAFRNKNSDYASHSGCDYCYLVVPATNRPKERNILPATDTGTFQIELTCAYPPVKNGKCSRLLKSIKERLVQRANYYGDTPTQYSNTPTCDLRPGFGNRYWGTSSYDRLLYTKRHWDPDNFFHHCQSVGSTDENCCPQ